MRQDGKSKMTGLIIAIIFLVGSIGFMIGGIILNQINPNYNSALAVPIFNAIAIILALFGVGVSIVAYQKNNDMRLATHTLALGIVCLIILVVLFPFSNSGALSIVR